MKKILLTLFVGFCLGGIAIAQEPTKLAKKKFFKPLASGTVDPVRLAAKEAEAKRFSAAKPTDAAKSTKAPAALIDPRSN